MKKFFNEFKEFISRGNVLDMAIGVIIATAFGKITTSLVNDVFMPFIGWVFGGADLTSTLNITVAEKVAEDGTVVPTVIGFGTFLSTIIDFVIVAFIVFLIVKAFNRAREISEKRKAAEAEAQAEEPAAEPEPSKEELLLAEIRDLLKNKQ